MWRKIMNEKECPFCSNDKVMFENELAVAIPDRYPVRPGHSLVMPRRHTASFFDLTSEEVAACFDLIKKIKGMLDDRYSAGGYKIGINVGRSSGQTVMHAHIHVVPMGGEPLSGRSEVFTRKDIAKEEE
jgi:diadenosine tetraphosphate (Ap4A) HIT family hydrolase